MAMIQVKRSIGSGDGCDSSKDSSQIGDRAIGTRTITSGVGVRCWRIWRTFAKPVPDDRWPTISQR